MLSCKKWGCGELTTWILRLNSGFWLSECWLLLLVKPLISFAKKHKSSGKYGPLKRSRGKFFFFKEFGEKNLILVFWPQCVLFNLAVWQGKAFWQWVISPCFVIIYLKFGEQKVKSGNIKLPCCVVSNNFLCLCMQVHMHVLRTEPRFLVHAVIHYTSEIVPALLNYAQVVHLESDFPSREIILFERFVLKQMVFSELYPYQF